MGRGFWGRKKYSSYNTFSPAYLKFPQIPGLSPTKVNSPGRVPLVLPVCEL
jgi:hypothetical protein